MDDPRRPPPDAAGPTSVPTVGAGTPAAGGCEATVRAPSAEALGLQTAGAGAPPGVVTDPLLGKSLGSYTVLQPLGSGGMSVVYLARHEGLKKLVALKVLRSEIAHSVASLARFHREAMAAASIGDPHIVDVTDYGVFESAPYLVMERLDGRDLRRVLASEGALAPGRAVAIARQILRALIAAHARGIVHRDLKPENVFLTERDGHDFVKLLDFGISKIMQPLSLDGSVSAATGTGVVMGTPQYIAPEQAHGLPGIDHRVDLYSLGVICYEMLTGGLPFRGNTALEVVMKHVQDEPQPPRQRRPDLGIPVELERVVLRALAKDPARRFQSAEEMLAALPDPLTLPGGFRSGALPPAAGRPRPRWILPAAVALLVVVGGLALHRGLRRPVGEGALPPDARSAARRPDAAPARRPPQKVRITVDAEPAEAELLLGDELIGRGFGVARVVRGEARITITVRASGFRTRVLTVTPDRDQSYAVSLQPDRPPSKRKLPARKKQEKDRPEELRPNPYH